MTETYDFILKNGFKGFVIVALIYSNERIKALENKLFACYEIVSEQHKAQNTLIVPDKCYAILPEPFKTKIIHENA